MQTDAPSGPLDAVPEGPGKAGSDYPQKGVGAAVDVLERLDLTSEEQEKIRRGNAERLFGPE